MTLVSSPSAQSQAPRLQVIPHRHGHVGDDHVGAPCANGLEQLASSPTGPTKSNGLPQGGEALSDEGLVIRAQDGVWRMHVSSQWHLDPQLGAALPLGVNLQVPP